MSDRVLPGAARDAERAAALLADVYPDHVASVEATRHWLRSATPEERCGWWKVEAGDEIVGWASAQLSTITTEEGLVFAGVSVHPAHRGRGVGSALAKMVIAHARAVGGRRVVTESTDDDGARRVASAHGFVRTGESRISVADPRGCPPPPPTPDGIGVVSFAELAGDPSGLYECDATCAADIPGNVTVDRLRYDDWERLVWEHPDLDRDASLAAVEAGRVVALTTLRVNGSLGRAENDITATLRAHRRRGLAFLLKSHSLRVAADKGVTQSFTFNDEENAAMLAVNTRLGFSQFATRVDWSYTL